MSLKQIISIALISLVILLSVIALFSCTTLDNAIDSIEQSHYQFYNNTKAVFVVKRIHKVVYCQSPTGLRFYKIKERYPLPDTIILKDHKWVYSEVKFIKHIPNL